MTHGRGGVQRPHRTQRLEPDASPTKPWTAVSDSIEPTADQTNGNQWAVGSPATQPRQGGNQDGR
jgi:hypothetical protein